MENKENGSALVAAALLGLDSKVVIVGGRRWVIHAPTIARIAGAAYHMRGIDKAGTLGEFISDKAGVEGVAKALSQLIDGTDSHWKELAEGTVDELAAGLAAAYSLIDVQGFTTLSTLAGALQRLVANRKQ